jgi:hypothetical protein
VATYTGVAVGPSKTAVHTDIHDPDYTGDVRTGVRILRVIASDGGVVPAPGVGYPHRLFASPSTTRSVGLSNNDIVGVLHRLQAGSVQHFAFYNGNSWVGVTFQLHYAYRSADKTTLVGRVIEQSLDLSEETAPNVRVFFQSANDLAVPVYAATRSDDNGGYIIFLDAGNDSIEYDISGFRPESCKVFELVRIDEHPAATDIVVRVPLICVLPEDESMGEPLDDVLNREIGHHNYEPVKTAPVITSSGAYTATSAGALPVDVAVGATVDVINTTIERAVAIDSIRVSADGDAEFRFYIAGVEVVPRKRTTKFDDDGELIGAALYANAGSVLRVVCINTTSGTPAGSIKAQATIAGRNL